MHMPRVNPYLPVQIRAAEKDDQKFVVQTWLESMEKSMEGAHLRVALSEYAHLLDPGRTRPNAYWPIYRLAIGACLARPTTQLLVASFSEDPYTLVGWACGEPEHNLLHFVYVRKDWWGNGLANALVLGMGYQDPENLVYTQLAPGIEPKRVPRGWRKDRLFIRRNA